jgi:hypothetical protein
MKTIDTTLKLMPARLFQPISELYSKTRKFLKLFLLQMYKHKRRKALSSGH